jgi:hypothetical protein
MASRSLSKFFRASVLLIVFGTCVAGFGQGPLSGTPKPLTEAASAFPAAPTPAAPVPSVPPPAAVSPVFGPVVANTPGGEEHRFWDRPNQILFAGAAAMNAADFAVTRANLQSGGQELNPMVRVFGRSSAGLAVNFAGETAGVVGLSYLFHKTGHHKLERMVSVVDLGVSAGAVSYGLTHR